MIDATVECLLALLPHDVPEPDKESAEDGKTRLAWAAGRYRRVSVIVGDAGPVSVTWLDGTNAGHGTEQFDGEAVPALLLSALRRMGWSET